MPHQTTILVDGNGLLYRMFYAIPPLQTRAGQCTNAVLGFIRALRQTMKARNPSHWMVAFDGGNDRRKAIYGDYKAQRPAMPDALREQVPLVEEYLIASRIPWVRLPGEEADDLLATAALQQLNSSQDVLILTSDKDLMQLVDDRTRLFTLKDISRDVGRQEVFNKTGVWPEQIAGWLAMIGDKVDNIPGVPGVGEKTAAKLLAEYGSIDSILRNIDRLRSERIRNAIADCREILARNMELVRLHSDVDYDFSPETIAVQPGVSSDVMAFLDRLELNSIIASFQSDIGKVDIDA